MRFCATSFKGACLSFEDTATSFPFTFHTQKRHFIMKTRLTACFFLLFTFLFSALSAQSPSATADGFEKKVIITKRSTDANGDEVTETLIKKGKAAENFDADQYLRDNRKDNVQIEIKVVEGPDQLPARAGRAWKNDNWSFNWNNVRDELDTRAFLGSRRILTRRKTSAA